MNACFFARDVTYQPSRRICYLVVSICLLSAFDSLFTLLFVTDGGVEANPYAAQVLSYGAYAFVTIKMALTALGTCVLAALNKVFLAYAALHSIAAFYMIVILLWATIWFC